MSAPRPLGVPAGTVVVPGNRFLFAFEHLLLCALVQSRQAHLVASSHLVPLCIYPHISTFYHEAHVEYDAYYLPT